MASSLTKAVRIWRRKPQLVKTLLAVVVIFFIFPFFFLQFQNDSNRKHDYHLPAISNQRDKLNRLKKQLVVATQDKKERILSHAGKSDKSKEAQLHNIPDKESLLMPGESVSIEGKTVVYKGCYQDSTVKKSRALPEAFWVDSNGMNIASCVRHCFKKKFPLAGVEYESECWCGGPTVPKPLANESLCNLPCRGKTSEHCGGLLHISVYATADLGPGPAQSGKGGSATRDKHSHLKKSHFEISGPDGSIEGYRGCMAWNGQNPIFSDTIHTSSSSMTVDTCQSYCSAYTLAILFNGEECHCGQIDAQFKPSYTYHDKCNVPCPGKSQIFCGGREHLSVYRTIKEDERCKSITLKEKGSMPLIALASFPGSGNTWVRFLIERITGIYSGSYYTDGELFKKGFIGEKEDWKKRNTVVVKTHNFDREHIETFDGGIVIVRNPYKAIVSEHNRKFGGHTGYAAVDQYKKGTEWNDFVMGKSRTWTNTAVNWLNWGKKVLIVHHEDLKSDLEGQLVKILEFLNLKLDEDRLYCVLTDPNGHFKRPSRKGVSEFDPFTEEMHEYMGLYIKTVALTLKLHNKPSLPKDYAPLDLVL